MTQITIPYFAQAIYPSWSRETSFDPAGWNEDNPAWGQCLVTSLVARDIFGGSIVKGFINEIEHYWNFTAEWGDVDFTRGQFGDGPHSTRVVACTRFPNYDAALVLRPGLDVLTEADIMLAGDPQDLLRRYTLLRTRFAFAQTFPYADRFQTTALIETAVAGLASKAKGDAMKRRMECIVCCGCGLIPGTSPIWNPEAGEYAPGHSSQICPACKDGQL
jgi:hypothetical protein